MLWQVFLKVGFCPETESLCARHLSSIHPSLCYRRPLSGSGALLLYRALRNIISGEGVYGRLLKSTCRYFPKMGEPQYRTQNTLVLIMGTPKKVSLILGNPHVDTYGGYEVKELYECDAGPGGTTGVHKSQGFRGLGFRG